MTAALRRCLRSMRAARPRTEARDLLYAKVVWLGLGDYAAQLGIPKGEVFVISAYATEVQHGGNVSVRFRD